MTGEKVLIAKKKGENLNIRIKPRVSSSNAGSLGYIPDDYSKILNPTDFNDLAQLFEDLSLLVDAPIEKAFFKYKERRKEEYPFF